MRYYAANRRLPSVGLPLNVLHLFETSYLSLLLFFPLDPLALDLHFLLLLLPLILRGIHLILVLLDLYLRGLRLLHRWSLLLVLLIEDLVVLRLQVLLYLPDLHVHDRLHLVPLRDVLVLLLQLITLLDQTLLVLAEVVKHAAHLLLASCAILFGELTAAGRVGLHLVDFVLLVLETRLLFCLSTALGPGVGRDTLNLEDWAVVKVLKLFHGIGESFSIHGGLSHTGIAL